MDISVGDLYKGHCVTEYSPKLFIIPTTTADPQSLKAELRAAGVRVKRVSDAEIPTYDITIPDDVRLLLMGDFLNYTKQKNIPEEAVQEANQENLGLVSAIARHRHATVLVGTNEMDVMGIIERNDRSTFTPAESVTKRMQDLCADGFVTHACSVVIDRGLAAEPDISQRRVGFHLDREFVATHAGITYGLWSKIGKPIDATSVVRRLNDDLLCATRALVKARATGDRVAFPDTLGASKYVQNEGFDKVSSPTTAHPHELHRSWSRVWSQNPQFGQLIAHMSVVVDRRHYDGNVFSYERFGVGFGKARYLGIVARLSPIISLHPRDRTCPDPDRGNIMVRGDVVYPIPVHSRVINGQPTKLRSQNDRSPFLTHKPVQIDYTGADLIRTLGSHRP
jgi:hypothetical protein